MQKHNHELRDDKLPECTVFKDHDINFVYKSQRPDFHPGNDSPMLSLAPLIDCSSDDKTTFATCMHGCGSMVVIVVVMSCLQSATLALQYDLTHLVRIAN